MLGKVRREFLVNGVSMLLGPLLRCHQIPMQDIKPHLLSQDFAGEQRRTMELESR